MSYEILKTELHKKVWGEEAWIVNNGLYCGKVLLVMPWHYCSIHRHLKKDETFHIVDGEVALELFSDDRDTFPTDTIDKSFRLIKRGDTVRIHPRQWHRFTCVSPTKAQILELSTTHDDDDVQRLEESGRWDEERVADWIIACVKDLEDNKNNK